MASEDSNVKVILLDIGELEFLGLEKMMEKTWLCWHYGRGDGLSHFIRQGCFGTMQFVLTINLSLFKNRIVL
jgi:hypothetical protein